MRVPAIFHSGRLPHPQRIPGFTAGSAGLLRWLGLAIGAFSLVAFGVLTVREGIPTSLEDSGWEIPAQVVMLAVVAIGYAIAWWREGIGSALLIVGGVVLGVFASIAYEPSTALFAALAFVVPGVLLALHWQWHAGAFRLGGMLASVAVVLAIGGYASLQVWDYYYGPTHPSSDVKLAPVDLVEWAWSGGVTIDGFVVVAELAEEGEDVKLRVAEDASFAGSKEFAGVQAPGSGRPVYRFEAEGLNADTEYHYAVAVDGELDEGRRGSLSTFPSGAASFTFALGSCIQTGSDGQVFDRIREADPLFMLIPGDFTYEDLESTDPLAFLDSYVENLRSPAQESLYLQAPVVYSWDDHDYGGNNSDARSPSREAVQEAYARYVPHYPLASDTGPIYQAFTVGRVRFLVTDTRSEQLPRGVEGGPTMLGDEQLEWLKGELLAARDSHALTVWVNGVPWIAEETVGADHWGGFAEEREEIAEFIAENGIDRLAMLSGDAHMVAIDDGTNSNYATSGEAGFPVFHAAALDRRGSVKGGPYSNGAVPGGGQFGLMDVADDGSTVTVTWSARDWEGEELLHHEFSVEAPAWLAGLP